MFKIINKNGKTKGSSEFSSYEIELQNRVNMKMKMKTRKCLQKFFFQVTNSTLQNIKLNFELLTLRLTLYFFTFVLLTQS